MSHIFNEMNSMLDGAITLSNENKCSIHTAFQSNDKWVYDWSEFCNDYNFKLLKSNPTFAGFFVCGMMGRFG